MVDTTTGAQNYDKNCILQEDISKITFRTIATAIAAATWISCFSFESEKVDFGNEN